MSHDLRQLRLECARTLLGLYKAAGAGHIGASLSCLEILIDVVFKRMQPHDHVVLSKGHAAAALYTVLARAGRIDEAELSSFYNEGTRLAAHPPVNGELAAIPFGTGSLGHGLSLACGMALSQRFTQKPLNVYCIVSDGDCNEGSTWEAALFAAHHRLSNLTVIVDANGLQGFGATKDVMGLEPFVAKWRAFGFETIEVANGNSFSVLEQAHASLLATSGDKPRCLLARTQKGHGVSYMQNKMEWHYLPMSDDQYQTALIDTDALAKDSRHA